jgi:hypothetical protein
MKRLVLSFVAILLLSCDPPEHKVNQEHNSTPPKEIGFDSSVLADIKGYYLKTYGQDTRMEEKSTDSTLELSFYNLTKDEDDYYDFLFSAQIPKQTSSNISMARSILKGDLNKDGIEDLVISIYTEGGGSGGNIGWDDIFIFLNKQGKPVLLSVNQSDQITGFSGDCQFFAEKIENGYLIGTSQCYTKDDSRCCPSLKYITKLQLKNEKLVFYNNANAK